MRLRLPRWGDSPHPKAVPLVKAETLSPLADRLRGSPEVFKELNPPEFSRRLQREDKGRGVRCQWLKYTVSQFN